MTNYTNVTTGNTFRDSSESLLEKLHIPQSSQRLSSIIINYISKFYGSKKMVSNTLDEVQVEAVSLESLDRGRRQSDAGVELTNGDSALTLAEEVASSGLSNIAKTIAFDKLVRRGILDRCNCEITNG